MSSPKHRLVLLAALSLAAACSDPVDKAAKQRIFSPEDPPKVVASAGEAIAADALAGNAALTHRVLAMGAAETTERLGAHKYTAQLAFSWQRQDGSVALKETRTLVAEEGGVAGDFHGTLDNSRDQGLEVMRVEGNVYARNKYGTFRERRRDRGMAEREREEIFGALRDFDALFERRLVLAGGAPVQHEGREAIRYQASLGPPAEAAADDAQVVLPAPVQPKTGVDGSTERRLTFMKSREPLSIDGQVVVDARTGVPLASNLVGRMRVPKTEESPAAELKMTVTTAITQIGVDPKLAAPKDFLADVDRPEGIAAALDRFGIPRGDKAKDAGTTPSEGPAEPEDEELEAP